MKTGRDYSAEERQVLLLRYLEGVLAERERREVEEILESSEEASRELDELRNMVQVIRKDQRIFCPEPWLISDFLETGKDPSGEISKHLRDCDACREEVAILGKFRQDSGIPRKLLEAVRKELGAPTRGSHLAQDKGPLSRVLEAIASFFRFRVAALAAMAVAVLLVLFLYPGPSAGPVVALSSVTWDERESDLGGGLLGMAPRSKERVTTILRFRGTAKPLAQDVIDALYQAVAPREQLLEEYDFIPPAKVKEVIVAETSTAADLSAMLDALRTRLAVEKVVLVTTVFERTRALIQTELIETSTGNRMGPLVHVTLDPREVESRIGAFVYGVLPPAGGRARTR